MVLTACTGRGGGQLPPSGAFTGPASFGFSFSCEDKGGLNSPTGQLKIQLSYTDHGTSPIGSSFGIHGIVDTIDPMLESEICIGQNPPPGGNELIFLGRYYLTSSAPSELSTCPTRDSTTTPMCRFEVIVQDNDRNSGPTPGDSFSIRLSNFPVLCTTIPALPACYALPVDLALAPYFRMGTVSSGNLTVD